MNKISEAARAMAKHGNKVSPKSKKFMKEIGKKGLEKRWKKEKV